MNKKIVIFISLAVFSLSEPIITKQISTEEQETHLQKRKKRRLRKRKEKQVTSEELPSEIFSVSHNTEPLIFKAPQQETSNDKELSLFLSEIEFTHTGIKTFFTQNFNRKEYGRDFLPHNFCHLTQFLRYGTQMNQPPEFFEGVIRLFNQKVKASPFVNSEALEKMLAQTTPYLEQMLPQQDKQSFWKDIKKTLWTTFQNKFSFLQQNPMGFFEDISDEIIQKVQIHVSSPEKLRGSTLRFVEGGVDKLVWSPYDQLETWKSFKNIGNSLTHLYEKNIITDQYDVNELYWGLVERYCYFLELTGPLLSKETIQEIHKDIMSQKIAWLNTEEQEEGLEKKHERLAQALIETQAKKQFSELQMAPHIIS